MPLRGGPIALLSAHCLRRSLLSQALTRFTGRNSAKATAAAAVATASSITDDTPNGQTKHCGDFSVVPPASPKRGRAKNHVPAVHGAISYLRWRSKYVREYRGGLYVAYNGKHHEMPHNAVTVSEVRFHSLVLHCTNTSAWTCPD